MDIEIDYRKFKQFALENGLKNLLKYCQNKYPELQLQRISSALWIETAYLPCVIVGENENLNIRWKM